MNEQRYIGQVKPKFSRVYEDEEFLFVSPLPYRFVIGVVGNKYAGKSVVSRYLVEEEKFKFYSLSDVVRDEAINRGTNPSAINLKELGNELRRGSQSYLARRVLEKIRRDLIERREEARKIIIDGFKNPEEIKLFCGLRNFYIFAIHCMPKTKLADWQRLRFERAKKKGLVELEAIGKWKDFLTVDNMDRGLGQPFFGQKVDDCVKLVKKTYPQHIIPNEENAKVSPLIQRVKELVEEIERSTTG